MRAPSDPVEIPPAVVMQRTRERNINRYRPLNSDIVNQSKHTIEMSNGAVLRKSGVALKKAKVPKKRAPGQTAAPPTPWDLKRKLLTRGNQPSSSKGTRGTFHSTMGKKSRIQNLEIAEDSDSDAKDHLPLITSKQAKPTSGGTNVGEEGQGTSSGGQDQIQPEIITTRPVITRQRRTTQLHASRKSQRTKGREIPEESHHRRRNSRRSKFQKFQKPKRKSGVGNNDLFPTQVKIQLVHWMKLVLDGREENEPP